MNRAVAAVPTTATREGQSVPDLTGTETEFEGPYGTAVSWPLGDDPEWAETVCQWILTAPQAHPAWSQYLMAVVRLRDADGFAPPKRQFDGATHELIVVALNPDEGPYTPENMRRYYEGPQKGRLPYLTPVNIACQIEGADEEARMLALYAAWGVTAGALWPETADAPSRTRDEWKSALVKTLAHIRGEAHAS
jgi:hypothetical protein